MYHTLLNKYKKLLCLMEICNLLVDYSMFLTFPTPPHHPTLTYLLWQYSSPNNLNLQNLTDYPTFGTRSKMKI